METTSLIFVSEIDLKDLPMTEELDGYEPDRKTESLKHYIILFT